MPAAPLHVEALTPPGGAKVALLHGFTQSSGAWAPFAPRLRGCEVVAPDLPGHGASSAVEADLWQAADAVAATVGPATYVGYSMGGRVLLHLVLAHPEVVQGLVLISATAGIDDAAERAARRASDGELARRVEHEGVEAFVRWWLTLPLFATLPPDAAALDARLGGSAAGLASSLRLAGAGTQEPLWGRLAEVTAPALVIAGALDAAYVQRAHRLAAGLGGPVREHIVEGAGHACHLEAPDEVAEVISGWLHTANPTARATPKTSSS